MRAYTNELFFHFPLKYLNEKQNARNPQSMILAVHTPRTPIPIYFPNMQLNPILNVHIDIIDIPIHNLTSPEARKVAGRVKEAGHISIALIPCRYTSRLVMLAVALDNLYILRIYGRAMNVPRTVIVIQICVIINSFLL